MYLLLRIYSFPSKKTNKAGFENTLKLAGISGKASESI